MEDVKTTPRRGQWIILLALAATFLLPLLGAWAMYHYQPFEERGGLEHGELITPTQRLQVPPGLHTPDGARVDENLFRGQWTLLYHSSAAGGQTGCDVDCLAMMNMLRRVHLAQNESMRQVQRVLVMPAGTQAPAGLDEGLRVLKAERWSLPAESVYVVGPQGFLVLRYPPGFDPQGLLTDLQRLLRLAGED